MVNYTPSPVPLKPMYYLACTCVVSWSDNLSLGATNRVTKMSDLGNLQSKENVFQDAIQTVKGVVNECCWAAR